MPINANSTQNNSYVLVFMVENMDFLALYVSKDLNLKYFSYEIPS